MVSKKSNAKPSKNRARKTPRSSTSSLRITSTVIIALVFSIGLYLISGIEADSTNTKKLSSNQDILEQGSSLTKEKPAFTFYGLLKGNTVDIKKSESYGSKAGEKKQVVYSIQAGSFKTEQQAEQRLVELTLLGFEPTISPSVNASGNRWHRVIIGPFTSRSEMATAKKNLMANKLEAMVREEKR